MKRAEHLQWCKERALDELKRNGTHAGWGSFLSDMMKHEETADHVALMLGVQLSMGGFLETSKQVEDFINGFN